HSPPRRRRARRLGLRHLRAQQPAVRPRHRTGVACRAGRVPDVRRRPEPGRHRADPPHARDRGGPGSVLHGGRGRAALPGDPPAGGSQAAARRDRLAARRRRVRRRWRPPPHRGRAPRDHRGRARRGLCLPPARGARQVNARRWRWVWWLAGLGGAALALKFFVGFPWRVTFAALLDASPWLLAVAFVVNLSSLVAKGWAWHLILKPVAPHSWRA